MRLSFIVATFAAGISVLYKSFIKENDGEDFGRNVIKTGGFIVLLGILGLIPPLQTISDMIAYIFSTIILLNDGYDIIQSLGAI
jgi:hypothetical protein